LANTWGGYKPWGSELKLAALCFFLTILLAVEAADACRSYSFRQHRREPARFWATNSDGPAIVTGLSISVTLARSSVGKDSIGNSRRRT
jgi:hypothetical protein